MNVLVTALGTMASACVVKQLRKKKDIYIIGTDIYPKEYIVTSKEIDYFIQVETVLNAEKYLNQLINICKKYAVEAIFPIIDEEVEILANNYNKFISIGTIPCISSLESVELCRDKLLTFKKIVDYLPDISIDTMNLYEYKEQWKYPVFVKPRKGRASINCMKIDCKEDLEYQKNKLEGKDFIVQKYYEGRFFSVDIVRNPLDEKTLVSVREELVRNKNGSGTVVEIVENKYLEMICKSVAKLFNINGVANIEFIYDDKGYHLVEINPRLPAGAEYSCMAGLDLVNLQLDIMMKKNTNVSEIKYGKVYARRYEAYEMHS